MRSLVSLLTLVLLAGCSGVRSYSRSTLIPLPDVYACASQQLQKMGYELVLQDSVGGLVQGRREITGLVETARRGAAKATEIITVGLAGGSRTRFDELTVFVYTRHYPQGNAIETTAGLLTVTGEVQERGTPTDEAKRDARRLLAACALRR